MSPPSSLPRAVLRTLAAVRRRRRALAVLQAACWTLAALFPLLFKNRPWTPFLQCVFAVLVAHVFLSVIIDTDHWRHMYMLYGLAWGLIAAEKLGHGRPARPVPAFPYRK